MKTLSKSQVVEAIMEVRDSGIVNMLDRNRVIECLLEFGHSDVADWVADNHVKYADLVFKGDFNE